MNTSDIKFLKDMISHHMAALKMSAIVLKNGEDAKVKTLANSILNGQQKEIDQMKAMLADTKEAKMKKAAEDFINRK